jgi:hypothetical protein
MPSTWTLDLSDEKTLAKQAKKTYYATALVMNRKRDSMYRSSFIIPQFVHQIDVASHPFCGRSRGNRAAQAHDEAASIHPASLDLSSDLHA